MLQKIENFDPRELRNAEHVRFGEEIETICKNHFPPDIPIGSDLRVKHTAAWEGLSSYFLPQRQQPLTTQLIIADRHRDNLFTGLKYGVMSAVFHPDPVRKKAGESILSSFRKYGPNINKLNYGAQTAVVDNLLDDLVNDAELSANLTLLNLNEWVSLLATANEQFKSLYDQRADENAGPDVKGTELRSTLRLAYLGLADYISSQITVTGGGDPWQKMAYLINERIKTWKLTISRRDTDDSDEGR